MRYFIFSIGIFLLLTSCKKSPYPGFTKDKNGIYYQLHSVGESTVRANTGDYITADLVYKTMGDSVFFKGRRKLQLEEPTFEGSIEHCFRMISEEESATFIIGANDFFLRTLETSLPVFLDSLSNIKIYVSVIEIQTKEEYQKEKEAFLNWIEDFGEYEKVILNQFLNEKQLPVKPVGSDMYYFVLKQGKGPKIQKGDTITVNYEGRFLNGRYFDSTIRRKQPFQFVYGTEWQVIEGLEEAIGMMQNGEKSLFIIPSNLAFGNKGSSTGIIPPFTSLIFEVEIISVNEKSNQIE